MESVDVVVVGGGVAGAAVAGRMSAAGARVVVLEQSEQFVDRVRGELVMPWGVGEAIDLGLGDVVRSVDHCNVISRTASFDETVPEAVAAESMRDLSSLLPGVPGALGVSHPGLSEAVLANAAGSGAVVRRGTTSMHVNAGLEPTVQYEHAGHRYELNPRIVVAADGRGSSIRRQFGLTLHETQPIKLLGGMLVAGTHGWPRDVQCIGVEDDREFLFFPQADGLMRVYLAWSTGQPTRFAGADRQRRFLDTARVECVSMSAAIADGVPAGPCSWFPMTDSWLECPLFEGLVFAGDAAGWSNPLIGQGLSVALRDARVLSDLLLTESDWTPDTLHPYVEERAERMRRLRFCQLVNDLTCSFGPAARESRIRIRSMAQSDPILGLSRNAQAVGPWRVPPEGFTDTVYQTLAAA